MRGTSVTQFYLASVYIKVAGKKKEGKTFEMDVELWNDLCFFENWERSDEKRSCFVSLLFCFYI